MNIIKSLILLSAGVAFGIATVLSCSDDARHSDAATCDCPASEAPIAGRIVAIDSDVITIAPGQQGTASTGCSPGMQFISGSCGQPNLQTTDDITLQIAAFEKTTSGWLCVFKNNKTVPVQVKATILCLKPSM